MKLIGWLIYLWIMFSSTCTHCFSMDGIIRNQCIWESWKVIIRIHGCIYIYIYISKKMLCAFKAIYFDHLHEVLPKKTRILFLLDFKSRRIELQQGDLFSFPGGLFEAWMTHKPQRSHANAKRQSQFSAFRLPTSSPCRSNANDTKPKLSQPKESYIKWAKHLLCPPPHPPCHKA